MRYMGSVGALSLEGQAAVSGFERAYPSVEPSAQRRMFEIARDSGGGADAAMADMAKHAAIGAALGAVLGFALARRKR